MFFPGPFNFRQTFPENQVSLSTLSRGRNADDPIFDATLGLSLIAMKVVK